MIKNLIVLFTAFLVTNSNSNLSDISYRVEIEIPKLNPQEEYVDFNLINSGFETIAKRRVAQKTAIINYIPNTEDYLNSLIYIRNFDDELVAKAIKIKIFYKNSLIYKYWSYTDKVSTDFFNIKKSIIPIEFR